MSSQPATTAASDGEEKRPQFGTRYLNDPNAVYEHNAWDDVELTEEQLQAAKDAVTRHANDPVPVDMKEYYNADPASFWDAFYSQHENRFFKDRRWLFTEFPELLEAADQGESDLSEKTLAQNYTGHDSIASDEEPVPLIAHSAAAKRRILEVGCGVGNTVFPLLRQNRDPSVFVYACDYAPTAISIVRSSEEYRRFSLPQTHAPSGSSAAAPAENGAAPAEDAHARCHAFVCDISQPDSLHLPDNSIDVITCIFVLSALTFEQMKIALAQLARVLRPGGLLLFRDYGRYDLAQVRLKGGRLLDENFYIRGDGTRVYFYTTDEVAELMAEVGLAEEQNRYDKRLIVNRAKKVTMQRVWVQGKFRKQK